MDNGQKDTERIIKEIEARINKEYSQAVKEIEETLNDYLKRFKIKDQKWQEWVENGTKTESEYKEWRKGQLAVGKRWENQRDAIAHDLAQSNELAKKIVRDRMPEVYAANHNYATYQIEKDAGVNTSYTLYNKEAVARIMESNPEMLPPVGKKVAKDIAEGKAVKWNNKQIQSVMIQGILQGDSIPKLATRLATTVGDSNRKAAVRNARTMAISAQNAGRVDAYKRAKKIGVDAQQMWLAVHDGRTRHSHRQMDREIVDIGEPFSNGCRFPADPQGEPSEVYNCRCSVRGIVKGLEPRAYKYRDDTIEGMTYEEWKEAKARSNPILLPEEKARAIKNKYLSEYRHK